MAAVMEVHPFEKAGLGKAPFRFMGVRQNLWSPCPGEPAKPGGCCAYCYNGILNEYVVRDADGKVFTVGSECAYKISRTANAPHDPIVEQIKAAERKLNRDKRHAREAERIEEGKAWFEANREAVAAHPHPNSRFASAGKTLADWVDWNLQHAGTTGRLHALSVARKKAAS
jgi:hypothetical protein